MCVFLIAGTQEDSGLIPAEEVEALARRLDPDATPWKIQVSQSCTSELPQMPIQDFSGLHMS